MRAICPSLSAFGINNALSYTTAQLTDQNGMVARQNDDWQSGQKQELEAVGLQPTDPREAAIVETRSRPGSTQRRFAGQGPNRLTGNEGVRISLLCGRVVLAVSERLYAQGALYFVNTTSDIVIAGACTSGTTGFSLRPAIQAANAHPGEASIDSTIPPGRDLESAIVQALPANGAQFTANVRGVNDTTGIAVVEVLRVELILGTKRILLPVSPDFE